jgi:hypothetical protein
LGRFDQVGADSGMSFDSYVVVVPKLCRMSGALSSVVWFLDPIFIQKIGRALALIFSFFFLRLIKIAAKLLPSFLKKTLCLFVSGWQEKMQRHQTENHQMLSE